MDRLKQPRGLIRYDSLNGLAGRAKRVLRPRLALYAVAAVALVTATTFATRRHHSFEANLLRNTGTPYFSDGKDVINGFEVHLVNKGATATDYTVAGDDPRFTFVVPVATPHLEGGADVRVPVMLPGRSCPLRRASWAPPPGSRSDDRDRAGGGRGPPRPLLGPPLRRHVWPAPVWPPRRTPGNLRNFLIKPASRPRRERGAPRRLRYVRRSRWHVWRLRPGSVRNGKTEAGAAPIGRTRPRRLGGEACGLHRSTRPLRAGVDAALSRRPAARWTASANGRPQRPAPRLRGGAPVGDGPVCRRLGGDPRGDRRRRPHWRRARPPRVRRGDAPGPPRGRLTHRNRCTFSSEGGEFPVARHPRCRPRPLRRRLRRSRLRPPRRLLRQRQGGERHRRREYALTTPNCAKERLNESRGRSPNRGELCPFPLPLRCLPQPLRRPLLRCAPRRRLHRAPGRFRAARSPGGALPGHHRPPESLMFLALSPARARTGRRGTKPALQAGASRSRGRPSGSCPQFCRRRKRKIKAGNRLFREGEGEMNLPFVERPRACRKRDRKRCADLLERQRPVDAVGLPAGRKPDLDPADTVGTGVGSRRLRASPVLQPAKEPPSGQRRGRPRHGQLSEAPLLRVRGDVVKGAVEVALEGTPFRVERTFFQRLPIEGPNEAPPAAVRRRGDAQELAQRRYQIDGRHMGLYDLRLLPRHKDEDRDADRLLKVASRVVEPDLALFEANPAFHRGSLAISQWHGRLSPPPPCSRVRGRRAYRSRSSSALSPETRGSDRSDRGGIVIDEGEKPRVFVGANPGVGVSRDRVGVFRPVAVIDEPFEPHVEADRRVTGHEEVVHEAGGKHAMATKRRPEEGIRLCVHRTDLIRVGHPPRRVDAEGRGRGAGEHADGPRPRPRSRRIRVDKPRRARAEAVEMLHKSGHFRESSLKRLRRCLRDRRVFRVVVKAGKDVRSERVDDDPEDIVPGLRGALDEERRVPQTAAGTPGERFSGAISLPPASPPPPASPRSFATKLVRSSRVADFPPNAARSTAMSCQPRPVFPPKVTSWTTFSASPFTVTRT
ncbi:hypothetical protein OUZ56_032487 [Daphnia magna]|uniref:Uncharacterized protein n=1 Tax=Daphnia magna TaxID=35525 RepID=A0ABR0B920_9CRUS|nr:hypothetical protein OUZ56_032487 [Daphnia magna]